MLLIPTVLAGQELDLLLERLQPSRKPHSGRINAHDANWEAWLQRSGERFPNLRVLPSWAMLPDSLHGVSTPEQWEAKREWMRNQFTYWVYGKMPPAPTNLRAVVLGERQENGVTVRDVRLEFGPGHKATLRLQLLIPPGNGPFPVFLTNHPRTRPWVATAVRRGYIACIYFAADPIYGNDDDSDAFIDVYPEYDFSCLARWAWAAMRAVDHLVTLPEVARDKIGITGHSRNGKQALLAAAFDDRIGAVVASSGNTGEGTPWRFTSDPFANETIEQITGNFPHWFHPRLRFFAGREHKLPVDQNSLFALVAPRGLLLASSYSEHQGNSLGFEQGYRDVQRVYNFLGKPDNVGLSLRPGEHATTADDIERYVDFFDTVFGRAHYPKFEDWIHGYTFEDWQRKSGEKIDPAQWPQRRPGERTDPAALRKDLRWLLGEEPAGVDFPNRTELDAPSRTSDGWLSLIYQRPLKSPRFKATAVSFGDDLMADLYYPPHGGGKWPLVVWLHAYSYPTGYSRYARPLIERLVGEGFAVLAFDQIGFGTRLPGARRFYDRYPRWSLMGKMVADTRAAISAAAALEAIDADRIYLAGYSLGSHVALLTAALDERVRGVAAVAGFTSFRADPGEPETEGLRHYSHIHGLLPRLGFFLTAKDRVPFDHDEALALVAPRPVLWIAPEFDRYAPAQTVEAVATAARAVYERRGAKAAFTLERPRDFNRFPVETQRLLVDWLARQR